jgi:hypothetical protein
MKRRKRPVARRSHMTMLDRVEVDVFDMPPEIDIITDRVFPVAPLPDAPLASRTPDR